MRKLKLYALMITTAVLALAAVAYCALIFLMMVVGDCGVTVFDSPTWPLQLLSVLAVVGVVVFVAVKAIRYYFRRLLLSSLR